MPPSRLSKVVLPEPEGPITATKSPAAIVRSRRSKIVIVSLPLTKLLPRPVRRTRGFVDIDLKLPCGLRTHVFKQVSFRGPSAAREPGTHNHWPGLWVPGSPLRSAPE